MKANNHILEVNNISKIYPTKNKPFVALDDVSLYLNKGEALGIVGESGSGKSTLAKIISQIEAPSQGDVFFCGKNIFKSDNKQRYQIRRNIQMVFQNPRSAISPKMTIGDFLIEGLINYRLASRQTALAKTADLLNMVELPADYVQKMPNQLSGGEMQRVVIARAISVEPKIIIFDEATSALDVLVRHKILKLLVKLKSELNLSYLFIGHNLAVVRLVTSRMLVMNQGKIIEALPSKDFMASAQNEYTKSLIQSVLTTRDSK